MSNDDKRRRRDGSTAQLSVAELIARRETETQPIPRITDDETVRFKPQANLSGRELHITELLRREGRAGEEERGGGFSVPKLVAMAGGGVVLAGTVAFTASNLLSGPDERPLAEVRYDTRPASRSTNTIGNDLAAAAKPPAPQTTVEETTDTTAPSQTATQQPRATQRPAPTTTTEQAPVTEQPPAGTTTTPPGTSRATTTTTTPSSTPSASSSSTTPSSGTSTPPPSSSTPPPSTSPSTTPSQPVLGIDLNLGGILEPIGGFDFFGTGE